MNTISIRNKHYSLPMFLPDATRAVVKGVDAKMLESLGIEGIVVNTLHLADNPGKDVLEIFGGVKEFMNYNGLVVTDSGGWQIFSLLHKTGKGEITDAGVVYPVGVRKTTLFTPEQSIDMQLALNPDICVTLDHFTPPGASVAEVEDSVERTLLWAKRCKEEFEKITKGMKNKPLLIAPIQGGESRKLRKYCAEALINIGFDGYGFGGYLVEDNQLDYEMLEYLASLIPENSLKFALGVGKPKDIVVLRKMGWDMFDCTLPTRDARNKRMYVFNRKVEKASDLENDSVFGYVYLDRGKYATDEKPVSEYCNCFTCKNYTRAYLHHLFSIKDTLAYSLATIHNLYHYQIVVDLLKKRI